MQNENNKDESLERKKKQRKIIIIIRWNERQKFLFHAKPETETY